MVQLKGNLTHTVEHKQLIGQKHTATSNRIGMCGKKTCQHYFCKRQECKLSTRALQWVFMQLHTFFSDYVHIHTRGETIRVNAILRIVFECIAIYCHIVLVFKIKNLNLKRSRD